MNKLALLLAVVIAGCSSAPAPKFHASGWVRSVWYDRRVCFVTIEGDDHSIFVVGLIGEIPPVWTGMHAEMEYQVNTDYSGYYKNLLVIKRLDVGK